MDPIPQKELSEITAELETILEVTEKKRILIAKSCGSRPCAVRIKQNQKEEGEISDHEDG